MSPLTMCLSLSLAMVGCAADTEANLEVEPLNLIEPEFVMNKIELVGPDEGDTLTRPHQPTSYQTDTQPCRRSLRRLPPQRRA